MAPVMSASPASQDGSATKTAPSDPLVHDKCAILPLSRPLFRIPVSLQALPHPGQAIRVQTLKAVTDAYGQGSAAHKCSLDIGFEIHAQVYVHSCQRSEIVLVAE